MAQFQVPQFQVEERIIGPLTLKKFGFVAAGSIVCFILFFLLSLWLWLIVAAIIGTIAASLAFITVNGQPLDKIAVNAFGYYWSPRFYNWQRKEERRVFELPTIKEAPEQGEEQALRPPAGGSGRIAVRKNLRDLWQKLQTTKAPIPKREESLKSLEEPMKMKKEKYGAFRAATGERIAIKKVNY
ncbi:MAG: PrgI family protein [Parcubacteria group bacterium]|nr:PrgI family protein [Parcubacteria group bacterium]